jgi:hypothetical protein
VNDQASIGNADAADRNAAGSIAARGVAGWGDVNRPDAA